MVVEEPIGAWWQELCAAMAESPTRTLRHDGVWEAQISEGNPVVCLLIGSRWWKLGLKHTRSIGQRAALEKIVSGAVIAGELYFQCGPVKDAPRGDGSVGDFAGPFRILCRMLAWLPRELAKDTTRHRDALAARVKPIRSDRSPAGADIYRSSAESHLCESRQLSISGSNVYKI